MEKAFLDAVGWVGACLLLLAYGLVSFRRLRADSLAYQFMNGVGSLFLVVNTVYYHAYPSAFVNVVWITIAVTAGIRMRGQSSYSNRQESAVD